MSDRRRAQGVEANARLTGATAAVLFILFAVEGVTILRIHSLLTPHVFVGMLMIPPAVVKLGSTGWRFIRYYRGAPAYRRKGPPPALLRVLGPFVVVLTALLLGSGVALLFLPNALGGRLLLIHKASFVLWFVAMTVHILGHALETTRLAPADWLARSRRDIAGAGARQWVVAGSLAGGVVLALLTVHGVGPYLAHYRAHSCPPGVSGSCFKAGPGPGGPGH